MDLLDELVRIVAAFEAVGIEHALCGGLAVAVHGAPRATTDLDLLVRVDQIEAAVATAKAAGFRFEARPRRFSDGMQIRRVTRVDGEHAVTLDLIVAGPDLVDLLVQRQRLTLREHPLWVIDRDGLIRMKLAAGRPQDLADVARLTEDDR